MVWVECVCVCVWREGVCVCVCGGGGGGGFGFRQDCEFFKEVGGQSGDLRFFREEKQPA